MRAVRLLRTGDPLFDDEIATPSPAAGEIVVRIRAAGICHSDGHYRAGRGKTALPVTLGHEVAGEIAAAGDDVDLRPGARVALHYLVSCRQCDRCVTRGEQFCVRGQMLGKERDGGYAEAIVVPACNAVPIPASVSYEQAAIMMCSTATAYHALRLSAVQRGETVAIIGFGGLGVSALQLARHLGAIRILALEVLPEKLALAESMGAIPIDARGSLEQAIDAATGGRGADVALDFAGHETTTLNTLRALAPGGRMILVAINLRHLVTDPYSDILGWERRIIGCSDHTRDELVELMDMAARGAIDLSAAVTRRVPLEAAAINDVLDELDRGSTHLRTVISLAAP